MKKSKMFLIIFIFLNMLLLNGCWDMREINEIGLVTAVGIDKAENGKYIVTVQIANPSTNTSTNSESTSTSNLWVGTEEGESLFEATRKLVKISSRRIMWAHNNVVIIGESLAKAGIIPVVDYFTHNPELRMKAAVAVAKGDAKDYITSKAGMENPSGVSFILLEGYRAISAESVESHMLEVSSKLRSEFENPLITEINLKKASLQAQEGKDELPEYSETINLEGVAVFKKDKMIGSLSPEESRGAAWIFNQTSNTVVTVNDPDHQNKAVAVETQGLKAKIKSYVSNGMPEMSIHIKGEGDIVEEDGTSGKDINVVKENVSALVNKKIEEEIREALDAIQKKFKVDGLGFAKIVHIQNNREWHNGLGNKWEGIFPRIPVSVTVDIKINTSSLNQQPFKLN